MNRELDIAIAQKVFGEVWWKAKDANLWILHPPSTLAVGYCGHSFIKMVGRPPEGDRTDHSLLRRFSSDMNAVFDALRKSGWSYMITNSVQRRGLVCITIGTNTVEYCEPGNEAETICRTLLKALEASS